MWGQAHLEKVFMNKHIHILGIGGTFMSALAILAKSAGLRVSGSDSHCYSPIRELLIAHEIDWIEGYDVCLQVQQADCVIVGNVMKRGMPVIEWILNNKKPYISGPQWLAENILTRYRVIAVAGTHGKTTTTAMLAHILEEAGLNPGFLIGGVAPSCGTNARLGDGQWFVIEADEYDSAFFDKRPKFIHYRPEVAILNNLEFDHADIYPDLKAIQQQFHYFLRTIPGSGMVIKPRDDAALNEVIAQGLYSTLKQTALSGEADLTAVILNNQASQFHVCYKHELLEVKATVSWPLWGSMNVENALSAIGAAMTAGVSLEIAARALSNFQPVKRRLEVKFQQNGVTVYDDFAHHPTAIAKTLQTIRDSAAHQRIFLVMEFASNTMRSGIHASKMLDVMRLPDYAAILRPDAFDLDAVAREWACDYAILNSVDAIVADVVHKVKSGDAVVVMSNRGFGNIQALIVEALSQHTSG